MAPAAARRPRLHYPATCFAMRTNLVTRQRLQSWPSSTSSRALAARASAVRRCRPSRVGDWRRRRRRRRRWAALVPFPSASGCLRLLFSFFVPATARPAMAMPLAAVAAPLLVVVAPAPAPMTIMIPIAVRPLPRRAAAPSAAAVVAASLRRTSLLVAFALVNHWPTAPDIVQL